MGLYFLPGVFLPLPASRFFEVVIFGNLLHIFSQVLGLSLGLFYYERSEFLIVGVGKNNTQKNVRRTQKTCAVRKKRAPILPASDSELSPRRSSGVRLAYTDPSGERQQAPSMPRWGPSSLQRSFRRAIASSVYAAAAVGSA